MIAIVNYGMGNLRSVQKAFERLGQEAVICPEADQLAGVDKLVLPGVGAFRDAMQELRQRDMVEPILEHIQADRPFLGICLGQQLLFDVSFEDGEWDGLGVVPGRVVRFEDQPGLKVPHMGWNTLEPNGTDNRLLDGIPEGSSFYFVHSYHVVPDDDSIVLGHTEHGIEFASFVGQGAWFATQFHPEKSQKVGLKLLENFAAL